MDSKGNFLVSGREKEMGIALAALEMARGGKGHIAVITGEPGIGKTAFLEDISGSAKEMGIRVLKGAGLQETVEPFMIFSRALEPVAEAPFYMEHEQLSFNQVFLINKAGLLVAKALPESQDLDADIFAGMLTAVQSFVKDSFDTTGAGGKGLGRLEYGDMKILIEHGKELFITAVLKGTEHPDMGDMLKRTIKQIEERHGELLDNWAGSMSKMGPVIQEIKEIANARFMVRRSLEGLRLENERLKIADNVLNRLRDAAQSTEIILILEDAHWADESSLFVLQHLARNIEELPIMILVSGSMSENHAFDKMLNEMEEYITLIELQPLDIATMSGIVERECGPNEFPDNFMERILEDCKGNPFFLKEMLRDMLDQGTIAFEDGKYVLKHQEFMVPRSLKDIVVQRLEKLEAEALVMVEYAACIGSSFDVNVAHSLSNVKDASNALESLHRADIIQISDRTAEFTHNIFQSLIYEDISTRWRATYHKSIGEYYESAYATKLDTVIYELARHFSKTREVARTFRYSIMAGEKAESTFAPEQAVQFYDQAISASKSADTEVIAEIHERLGDLHTLLGNYDLATKNLQSSLDNAQHNVQKARAHRKLALIHINQGSYDLAKQHLDRGTKVMQDSASPELGRIMNLYSDISREKGELDQALEQGNKALELFQSLENCKEDLSSTHSLLGKVFRQKGDHNLALKHYNIALEISKEIGQVRNQGAIMTNIGNIYGDQGDNPGCLAAYEKGLEIFQKVGDVRAMAVVSNNMGILLTDLGDFQQASDYLESSLDIYKRIGDIRLMSSTLSNMGNVLYYQGDFNGALEYYQKSAILLKVAGMEKLPAMAPALINIGCMHHELGNYQLAMENLEKTVALSKDIGSRGLLLAGLTTLADILVSSGDIPRAKEIANEALELARETGFQDSEGEVLAIMGDIAGIQGDEENMVKFFNDAIEKLSLEGMDASQAAARMKYGKNLARLGKNIESIEQLEEAAKLFASVKMIHKVEEANKVISNIKK